MRITHNIQSVAEFEAILQQNKGVIIIKIGAEWCGPCRAVTPYVMTRIATLPDEYMDVIVVDADESAEFFAFMKRKKMVSGIPVLFGYVKGNTTFVPDFHVVGTNRDEIDEFFTQCLTESS